MSCPIAETQDELVSSSSIGLSCDYTSLRSADIWNSEVDLQLSQKDALSKEGRSVQENEVSRVGLRRSESGRGNPVHKVVTKPNKITAFNTSCQDKYAPAGIQDINMLWL